MHRRDFVRAGLTMAGALAARPLLGRPRALVRGAVVIGVDQAGTLPKLRAARSGAHQVAEWLDQEGFKVTPLIDDTTPVRASDVFAAVNVFAGSPAGPDQLVIYFAGHGFINSYAEYWLLSDAPDNPNEAVSVTESVYLAKLTAISNVVFISDACRSRADSLRAERVRGSLIFPNTGASRNVIPDVDTFYATLVGDPAWEVSVTDSAAAYEGIYTSCFLDAFKHPYSTMVRTVDGADVVPNTNLKPYLAREVPRRAQAASITINQRPDTQVVSDGTKYLGRVTSPGRLPDPAAGGTPTENDVPVAALQSAGLGAGLGGAGGAAGGPGFSAARMQEAATATGFASARGAIVQARGLPDRLTTGAGFAISGHEVKDVFTNPKFKATIRKADTSQPASLVDVSLQGARAATVALRFDDGSGTVLSALEGYIGIVVVDKSGVSSVSYTPMEGLSAQDKDRLAQLHAAVATSARFGVFRLEGSPQTRNRAASELADRIRVMKAVDPTLGVYAAYAYADAGLVDQARSVREFMRGSLGVDLFDVAMLTNVLSGKRPENVGAVFPCCPLLSQGWSLLRVRDVRLYDGLGPVQDHVRAGLWTTFDAEGVGIVGAALQQGRLT